MRFRSVFVLSLLLLSSALVGLAQSSAADISRQLLDKPLFLRGFWADDKLQFDAAGTPQGHTSTTSFTVSGVRIRKVQLQGDTLRLEGIRECLLFEDEDYDRVPLRTGKGKKAQELKIEIKGTSGQGFTQALHAVFAENLAELIPTLPSFWQRYAKANFVKAQTEDDDDDPNSPKAPANPSSMKHFSESGVAHVGGTVKPPKVTHSENPSFTAYARQMAYSGAVELYLWVEEDGGISHVSIAKPAGLGLDEAAVAAVMKYRFKPAMRADKPVKVDLYISVNFEIF